MMCSGDEVVRSGDAWGHTCSTGERDVCREVVHVTSVSYAIYVVMVLLMYFVMIYSTVCACVQHLYEFTSKHIHYLPLPPQIATRKTYGEAWGRPPPTWWLWMGTPRTPPLPSPTRMPSPSALWSAS